MQSGPITVGPSTDDTNHTSNAAWDVFPLGLLLGGVSAVTRAFFWSSARAGDSLSGEAVDYRILAMAERWPELLAEALIASVVSALVLTFAAGARRSLGVTFVALLVTFLAVGAFVTGFPAARPGIRPETLGAAAGITLLGFGLSRIPFRGVLALILGAVVGFGLPIAFANYAKSQQPGMPIRRVALDLVAASSERVSAVQQRPGAPIARGVLTPAVDQQKDTGDKVALIMPPPASVEFVVPIEADGARLQASVGMNASSYDRLGAVGKLPVEYRIVVDDEVVWSQVVEHAPRATGVWDNEPRRWRHVEVDGEPGVAVAAGQNVRLETELHAPSLPEGFDPKSLDKDMLQLGFGGPRLESVTRRPRQVPTADAPNIVFVVVDTLRRDRLGVYDYGRDTSPNIDRFAEDALVFDDAYTTSSWTWPSTASLMTSLPPDAHGVKSSEQCTLAHGLVTLAEVLQERGYTTAAFVGNPIVEPNRQFDQGFEHFDVAVPNFRMSDEFMPDALAWIDEHAPLRFFLYLHLVDPHTPHRPHPAEAARLKLPPAPADWPERGMDGIYRKDTPSDAVKQYANHIYDASVATSDRWFGELLQKLDALELTDSTIICVTSDHGEELFDRGFRGHGHSVHAELVRAPLLFRGPGIKPGRRRGVVSNRHVPTTLAAMADTLLPGHGLSLHLIEDAPPDEAMFETTKGFRDGKGHQQVFGIRRGSQTTVWWHSDRDSTEISTTDIEQYDMLSDPGQKNDLIKVAEDRARAAVERMDKVVETARAAQPANVMGVGDGGQQVLKSIGYTDAGADDSETTPTGTNRSEGGSR